MSEKKSIGTVTLGCWNSEQREVEIENFMRCEFKDHRLISVVKTEEDAYLFCVENPDRKSTRLNSSHQPQSRMPSSA